MADSFDFEIDATPREERRIKLVGVAYNVKAPKAGFAMKLASLGISPEELSKGGDWSTVPAIMGFINDFIDSVFGPDQGEEVKARLVDNTDDLDLDHVMLLVDRLMEKAAANPTS